MGPAWVQLKLLACGCLGSDFSKPNFFCCCKKRDSKTQKQKTISTTLQFDLCWIMVPWTKWKKDSRSSLGLGHSKGEMTSRKMTSLRNPSWPSLVTAGWRQLPHLSVRSPRCQKQVQHILPLPIEQVPVKTAKRFRGATVKKKDEVLWARGVNPAWHKTQSVCNAIGPTLHSFLRSTQFQSQVYLDICIEAAQHSIDDAHKHRNNNGNDNASTEVRTCCESYQWPQQSARGDYDKFHPKCCYIWVKYVHQPALRWIWRNALKQKKPFPCEFQVFPILGGQPGTPFWKVWCDVAISCLFDSWRQWMESPASFGRVFPWQSTDLGYLMIRGKKVKSSCFMQLTNMYLRALLVSWRSSFLFWNILEDDLSCWCHSWKLPLDWLHFLGFNYRIWEYYRQQMNQW